MTHLAQYLYHTADPRRKGNSEFRFLSEEPTYLDVACLVLLGPKRP
jgi:hypothetical protein